MAPNPTNTAPGSAGQNGAHTDGGPLVTRAQKEAAAGLMFGALVGIRAMLESMDETHTVRLALGLANTAIAAATGEFAQ